jgi:hypothetical protein
MGFQKIFKDGSFQPFGFVVTRNDNRKIHKGIFEESKTSNKETKIKIYPLSKDSSSTGISKHFGFKKKGWSSTD